MESTALVLAPEAREKIQNEENEAAATLAEFQTFEIQSNDDLKFLAEVLAEVKGSKKRIEAEKEKLYRPAKSTLDAIMALFAPSLAHYAALEKAIKGKIAEAEHRFTAANENAMQAASTAHAMGDVGAVRSALSNVVVLEKVEGLGTRRVWKAKVTNIGMLAPAFVLPNVPAINEAMRASIKASSDGTPESIPGVTFYQEIEVSSVAK